MDPSSFRRRPPSADQPPSAAPAASLAPIWAALRGLGGLGGALVGVAAGAKVCHELLPLGMVELPERDHDAVPESPHFDAAWLTAALRRSGVLRAPSAVSALTVGEIVLENEGGENILNGGGFAGGRTVRVSGIAYSHAPVAAAPAAGQQQHAQERQPEAEGEALPTSLIQKWCTSDDLVPADAGGRLAMLLLSLAPGPPPANSYTLIDRELQVYRDVLPLLTEEMGVRTPRVYYAGQDRFMTDAPFQTTARFLADYGSSYSRTTMLLEDLGESGYIACGNVALQMATPLPHGAVEAALRSMARVHAFGWGGRGERSSVVTPVMAGVFPVLGTFLSRQGLRQIRQAIDVAHLWPDEGDGVALGAEYGYGVRELRRPEVAEMLYDLR